MRIIPLCGLLLASALPALAQVPPSVVERASYSGLFAAVVRGDIAAITRLAAAGEVPTLETALALGASAASVTSRYDGTALIAAAHLGHDSVVRTLIRAGAPLDHVNNLGWTALIESIVLGDGGPRHTASLKALIDAGVPAYRIETGSFDNPQLRREGRVAVLVSSL